MDFNKRLTQFCSIQFILFLLFLIGMIVQLNSAALLGPRLAVALKVLLVVLAFVGCGTSLALRD